ncbi:MAG TPA: hypothetical protein VGJ66_15275 [Pyrinomonadaceae bacterium]|jgi:hypothetical protein
MNSIARTNRYSGEPHGRNFSPHNHLIAIREESFKLATPHGLLNAQLVKIMRMDYTALSCNQSVRGPIVLPANPSRFKAGLKQAIPEPATKATSDIEPTRFRLRSVGEVLTDQNGLLYEVRGEVLHTLGKLVTDARGRMFEVCEQTIRVTANQDIETAASRPAEPANQNTGIKHRTQTPLEFLKALLTGFLTKRFRHTRNAI